MCETQSLVQFETLAVVTLKGKGKQPAGTQDSNGSAKNFIQVADIDKDIAGQNQIATISAIPHRRGDIHRKKLAINVAFGGLVKHLARQIHADHLPGVRTKLHAAKT